MASTPRFRGLGTLLRHLLELLDGDVQRAYEDSGLDYRPRYTPIVRALLDGEPRSIREIAAHAGMTHSAVSQTVTEMNRHGLVRLGTAARDARARAVRMSPKCRQILPRIERQWAATNAAADGLDADLSHPLSTVAREAIAALERQPFRERIARCARRKKA